MWIGTGIEGEEMSGSPARRSVLAVMAAVAVEGSVPCSRESTGCCRVGEAVEQLGRVPKVVEVGCSTGCSVLTTRSVVEEAYNRFVE